MSLGPPVFEHGIAFVGCPGQRESYRPARTAWSTGPPVGGVGYLLAYGLVGEGGARDQL